MFPTLAPIVSDSQISLIDFLVAPCDVVGIAGIGSFDSFAEIEQIGILIKGGIEFLAFFSETILQSHVGIIF